MNKKRVLLTILQSYIIFAVIAFGLITYFAFLLPYFPIDLTITKIIQHVDVPWFDMIMKFISNIGYEPQMLVIVLLVAVFLITRNHRWEAAISLISALSAFILGTIIKEVIDRPRPATNMVNVFKYLQDPSFHGHVLTYTVFFGFLLFLSYTLMTGSLKRTILVLLFLILIVLIGPSRIYLGEHWVSDVLGAYLLGSVILTSIIYIYKWRKTKPI
jgi:undecaprenyl-diphosphatase